MRSPVAARLSRIAYSVHSWTGLMTGWLLFIICVTGTAVVYKFPLKEIANPALVAQARVDNVGPDGALARFRAARPHDKVSVLAFPSDIFSIGQYSVLADDGSGKDRRTWISPTTGELHDALQSDFADFVQRLHAGLFMGPTGRWIVGGLGVAMALSLISGLIFHWHRLRRDLFKLRLGSHPRKAWADLHKFAGVWGFVFFLVIAATGAWLGIESLIGIRASSASPLEIVGKGTGTPLSVAAIVARARQERPDVSPTHVNFADLGSAGSTIRVQGDLPGWRLVQRGQTMLVFDADSGRLLQTVDRTEQGAGRRILAMMRPLHYGYFWSGFSEALYFLLGIGMSLLCASGLLIWAERDSHARYPRTADRPVTVMQRANLAVMGGMMLALLATALLAGAAVVPVRILAFDFLGSQDLLNGKPLAPELPMFLALWPLVGALLAWMTPRSGWRWTLWSMAAAFALLPCLAIAGASSSGNLTAVDTGYALTCLGLAIASVIAARRLGRATSDPKSATGKTS